MDEWGLLMVFAETPSFLAHLCFFTKPMSTNNIYIGTLNDHSQDHSKHMTVNVPAGTDVSSIVRSFLAEDVEPIQAEPVQSPSGELFKYIHVAVTSDDERLQIHRMVSNIVHLPKMQLICDELYKMMKNGKVLCSINPEAMLNELRRLGLPSAETSGFSDKNFYFYYKAPKQE
jgi:hypothetical protein